MARKYDLKLKVASPGSRLWDECASLEYRVFRDCGYIEENPEERIRDFDKYFPVEMICVQSAGRVVGTWRNIYAPSEPVMREGLFPTYDNASHLNIYPEKLEKIARLDPRKVADCAAAAILPEYRTGPISTMLFAGVMKSLWSKPPIFYGLGAVDSDWAQRVKRRNFPIEEIGPPTIYWGSYTIPVFINTQEILKRIPGAIPLFLHSRAKGYLRRVFG